MSVPAIAVEHVREQLEAESRLSEEELKVLAEIRAAKDKEYEKIKVRVIPTRWRCSIRFLCQSSSCPWPVQELQRQIADIDSELEFMSEVSKE